MKTEKGHILQIVVVDGTTYASVKDIIEWLNSQLAVNGISADFASLIKYQIANIKMVLEKGEI